MASLLNVHDCFALRPVDSTATPSVSLQRPAQPGCSLVRAAHAGRGAAGAGLRPFVRWMAYQISTAQKIRLAAGAATYGDLSLADGRQRYSVGSPGAYRHPTRSHERHGEGMWRQVSGLPVSLPDPARGPK